MDNFVDVSALVKQEQVTDKSYVEQNQFAFGIKMQICSNVEFHDVYLVCGDSNTPITFSSVFLRAYSPIIARMLESMPQASVANKATIYFRGIPFTHMKMITKFITDGQLTVGPDDLPDFTRTCNELRILGLCNLDSATLELPRLELPNQDLHRVVPNSPPSSNDASNDDPNGDGDDVGLVKLPDGKVKCLKCDKTLSCLSSGNRHYATNHQEGIEVRCKICKKECKNKFAYQAHVRNNHGVSLKDLKNVIKPPQKNVNTKDDPNENEED